MSGSCGYAGSTGHRIGWARPSRLLPSSHIRAEMTTARFLMVSVCQPRFFDPSGLLEGPAKIGLTCASFVLAVFDGARIPLVKTNAWPKLATTEDINRQKALLELQRHLMEEDHARKVKAEIGNLRYHPLDVAGAGTARAVSDRLRICVQRSARNREITRWLATATPRSAVIAATAAIMIRNRAGNPAIVARTPPAPRASPGPYRTRRGGRHHLLAAAGRTACSMAVRSSSASYWVVVGCDDHYRA